MTVASDVSDDSGTNPPDPIAAPQAAAPDDDRLITLTSFWTAPDAHIARIRLATSGVECYLFDENIVSIDWALANAVGGVKVKVRRRDAGAAMALLERRLTPVATAAVARPFVEQLNRRCPRCGSIDVYRESAWRR